MQNLRDKISSYTYVPPDELDQAVSRFKPIQLKKGEYLIKEGQLVDHFYFMQKGVICYYTLKDAKEQVIEFLTEDEVFTDLLNFLNDSPSNCFMKALEDCELYAISKKDFENLFDESHMLERFGRLAMVEHFLAVSRRLAHLTSLSNEERYLRLIKKRSSLTQRVPQYLIASYLGLTPVGLSKIRKRLSQSS